MLVLSITFFIQIAFFPCCIKIMVIICAVYFQNEQFMKFTLYFHEILFTIYRETFIIFSRELFLYHGVKSF